LSEAFVIREEKCFVFDDGTANGSAENVAFEMRDVAVIEEVASVESAVAQEFVGRAVKLVGAVRSDDIDLSAGTLAIFGTVGVFHNGEFADRVGRRPALFTFQAGAFLMVLVYSQLTDATALLIGGAVMGMFVNGMLGGYGALLSELYPTEARATAENVLFNLGRGVGGFGPFVIGALAVSYSFTIAIALLATIYLFDIVATAFLIPEKRGVPLE